MTESRKAYKADYWQQFKKSHKRVYGTLTHRQYFAVKARADDHGRSVWEQIWLESSAYSQQEFLPTSTIERELVALKVQLRKIGNNVNQAAHHGNRFKRLIGERQIFEHLKQLEKQIEQSVKKLTPR